MLIYANTVRIHLRGQRFAKTPTSVYRRTLLYNDDGCDSNDIMMMTRTMAMDANLCKYGENLLASLRGQRFAGTPTSLHRRSPIVTLAMVIMMMMMMVIMMMMMTMNIVKMMMIITSLPRPLPLLPFSLPPPPRLRPPSSF